MISKLILLANFLVLVASDGYSCGGDHLINPPSDLTKPYYFPENWNEGSQPATFNASQNCNWQINVLDGMYATVNFYKDLEGANSSLVDIYVNYPSFVNVYLQDNDEAPYIFTSQQFRTFLRAGETQGKFSFKIVWSYYPAEICKINIQLDQTQLIPQASTNCAVTFTAPNRVWLIAFDNVYYRQTPFLRHSAVFEGGSVNGKFLGTLDFANSNNIWSSGRSLTVYTFGMQLQDNRNIFLGMDANAAGGTVDRFDGLDCTDPCTIYSYTYDFGTRAVVTASRNVDYLYFFQRIQPNATLSIYEGKLDNQHLLTTMNGTNYFQRIPLAVKNTVKIYKTDWMGSQIYATRDAGKAKYGSINGAPTQNIVHSFDYRQFSLEQDTFENFTTGVLLVNFNFNVVYFDVNGPTTLEIKVYQNDDVMYSVKFNTSNMPLSSVYTAVGNKISINYQTYGFGTRGFEVDFASTKYGGPPPQTTTVPSTINPTTTVIPTIPTTTVLQSTVSTPVITTEKVITTTKGSNQNYVLLSALTSAFYFFV